jgi:hypothetical protein
MGGTSKRLENVAHDWNYCGRALGFGGLQFSEIRMSCGGCCQDFQTCCQLYCCHGQPVVTSGPAVCAAECATVGTPDTINALISGGFGALNAFLGRKCQQASLAKTAVRAQAQVATAKSAMWMWIGIAALAIVAFIGFSKMK